MSKPRKDAPLKMPRYRGGDDAMLAFLQDNLNYPKQALEQKIEGVVEVAFDVDSRGRVFNARVIQSLGFGCDEEVLRLVELLKFEKAYNKGRNVCLHKKVKVRFKLPQAKPDPLVRYSLVPNKTESKEEKPQKMSYTIRF